MIERIEEALARLLSDPSAAVREAASGAMDRTRAKRSVEEFRSRIRGGTVEEKLRAIYAAAELGGSEGVSLLLQALSDRDAEIRGAAVRALSPFPSPHPGRPRPDCRRHMPMLFAQGGPLAPRTKWD